ncbi:MAG: hypothetical protein [Bacteriophage sp.]|nr:MAG: hypothetical protein [Bacteriophage sp.]
MAGITIRNADGNVSVSSDFTPLTGITLRKITTASDSGDIYDGGIDNAFSPWDSQKVYFMLKNSKFPEIYDASKPYVTWFQLYDGHDACPGGFFSDNCGQLCISNTVAPTKGKYLNVYDANGNITWSVESCAKMPRIIGELFIPPNLKFKQEMTFTGIPKDAYFLANCFFCDDDYGGGGELGNDSQLIMMAIKREGTNIRFIYSNYYNWWVDQIGTTIGDVFPGGIYIPYASISI